MESFFGRLYTGVKTVAAVANTAVTCAGFALFASGPIVIPVVYAVLTGFSWVDLFFHRKNARLAAEIRTETDRLSSVVDTADKINRQNAQSLAVVTQERDKLSKATADLSDQLRAQAEINAQAKKLLVALMSTEASLSDVRDGLVASIEKTERIADVLDHVSRQLLGEKFSAIDVNGDGNITMDELEKWAGRKKN